MGDEEDDFFNKFTESAENELNLSLVKPLSVTEFNKFLFSFNPATDIWQVERTEEKTSPSDENPYGQPFEFILINDFDSGNILNQIYASLYSFYNPRRKTKLENLKEFFSYKRKVNFEALTYVLKSFQTEIDNVNKLKITKNKINYTWIFNVIFGHNLTILNEDQSLIDLLEKINQKDKILQKIQALLIKNQQITTKKIGGTKRSKTKRRNLLTKKRSYKKKRAVTKRRTQNSKNNKVKTKF